MKAGEEKGQYELAVFIGRMQPMHNGHLSAIKTACESAKKVLVLVGSSNAAPSTKNPFTAGWRIDVARAVIADELPEHADKVVFERLQDLTADNLWTNSVRLAIKRHSTSSSVVLVGCHKGDNHFLKWFPEIDFIEVPPLQIEEKERVLSSSFVREYFFESPTFWFSLAFLRKYLPNESCKAILDETGSKRFQLLMNEAKYLRDYKASRPYKYPINDVTADAFVVCEGHVLLVSRGRQPGVGLLALPGGFVNTDESLLNAALRELGEETGLHLLPCDVAGSRVFDNPSRSQRGRIITHVYKIEAKANPDGSLPIVKAGDDASRVDWYPIEILFNPENAAIFFEDHYDILVGMMPQECLGIANE